MKELFRSPWKMHTLLCGGALVATALILWMPVEGDVGGEISPYAGTTLVLIFCSSLLFFLAQCSYRLCMLRYKAGLLLLLAWLAQWLLFGLVFVFLCIIANVPPPRLAEESQPIQVSDTLYLPNDILMGQDALVLTIDPEPYSDRQVQEAPQLSSLDSSHADILDTYIRQSPRWTLESSDAFYASPGHVVMIPANSDGNMVHVAFRRVGSGEPLPQGYVVIRAGDSFPEAPDEQGSFPDLALDLGKNHYLLLAWRGANKPETAAKAINAAISEVDSQFQVLAAEPNEEGIQKMLNAKSFISGQTPEIRLCEPPAQYGAYQAEFYANPGESGRFFLYIKELKSGKTLHCINFPAQYSHNKGELFRYDIPGSMPHWVKSGTFRSMMSLLPGKAPLFAIRSGNAHQYFGVAIEVWFQASKKASARRLLLRRCYKVQAYEPEPEEEKANGVNKQQPESGENAVQEGKAGTK